ncbi:MAG: DUF190 domain-containing protein [Desulfobacterales bacterium]
MSLNYRVIEIYTAEEARHEGRPVADAVVDFVKSLKLAARCMVFLGRAGCYESGEAAFQGILTLSYNLPVKIEILLPAAELDAVLPRVEAIVEDGIIAVREMSVLSYRVKRRLIPRHVRVKDIMTPDPVHIRVSTPLDEAARLLLGSVFGALPVVNAAGRPVGIVTQGDLIYKAGMPLRIRLLEASHPERVKQAMAELARKTAGDVMTSDPACIKADERVSDAVDLMVSRGLKRFPVIDDDRRLVGMLSRLDVFQTISREAPDWSGLASKDILVGDIRYVSEIMRRDSRTVRPEVPVEEVIRVIATDDLQRVAVVDEKGTFLGMISDRDLLEAFSGRGIGFWEYLACRLAAKDPHRCLGELRKTLQEKTAADVMQKELVIVGESTPIDEAVRIMVENRLKRLPVVDANGRFRGMISRNTLLKTGVRKDAG